jgi:hypothetical protein
MAREASANACLLVLTAAIACGNSSASGSVAGQGSATVNGAVHGQSVMVTDVIGLTGKHMSDAAMDTYAYAAVIIANQTGTCARAPQDVWTGGPGYQVLVIDAQVAGASAVAPGTYSVGNTGVAQLNVYQGSGMQGTAGGGTITFTSVGTVLEGSFDVSLAGGYRLTGQFSAPVCADGADPFPT